MTVTRKSYRRKVGSSWVKVDFDRSNDYADGYRSGRRYGARRLPATRVVWFAAGMTAELALVVLVMSVL